jgi:hypothetical protein
MSLTISDSGFWVSDFWTPFGIFSFPDYCKTFLISNVGFLKNTPDFGLPISGSAFYPSLNPVLPHSSIVIIKNIFLAIINTLHLVMVQLQSDYLAYTWFSELCSIAYSRLLGHYWMYAADADAVPVDGICSSRNWYSSSMRYDTWNWWMR